MDFRGPRLGPGGSEARHFQDSNFPNLSYGPMQDALKCEWVNGGTGYYNWQTNGTSTHHSSQIMSEWMPGDNGINQLLFALTPEPGDSLETDQRLHGQHMFGLSMLNYMLRYDPDWRARFGSIRNGDELLGTHINYLGIQKVEQRAVEVRGGSELYTDEQAYTIFGRHSLPNIWLASGPHGSRVTVGNSLYLVLRRHRFVEDPRRRRDAPHDPATRSRLGIKDGRKRVADDDEEEEDEMLLDGRTRKRTRPDPYPENKDADRAYEEMYAVYADASTDSDVATPLSLKEGEFGKRTTAVEQRRDWEADDKDDPEQEYYWSFDPFVSHLRTSPDPCIYNNANGEGTPIHIGLVSHLVGDGPNDVTAEMQKTAQQGLYPTKRDKAYQQPLYKTDQVEIMVRVGASGMM